MTGSTAAADVETFPFRPSHVVDSVADLIDLV
jgi:NagD protein